MDCCSSSVMYDENGLVLGMVKQCCALWNPTSIFSAYKVKFRLTAALVVGFSATTMGIKGCVRVS